MTRVRVWLCWLLVLPTMQSVQADDQVWQSGAAIDLSYANAFQAEDKLIWRSKATTQRLNQFAPNLGMAYLRKTTSTESRWGLELGIQAGYDSDGQVPGQDRLPGYRVLRYLSRANASYLLPVGNGLTVTAGLMNSFIGYESMFAKDNPNYTRSWMADYSPYYLIGAGAQYPLNDQHSLAFYLLSDYDYLAYRSDQPKYAGQWAWQIDQHWKFSQSWFAGPEQKVTDTRYWRYFSDSILQWNGNDFSLALAYDVGTEKLATLGEKQALWMGSAVFGRWHVSGPWSLALRPEVYWDGDGHMTGHRQLIKAVTATVEYKLNWNVLAMAVRGEYRFDSSNGKQGGFFKSIDSTTAMVGDQHLLLFSCLLMFDQQ